LALSFFIGVDHFLVYTTPTLDDPALLIVDGRDARTRNLEVIERAKENAVTTVCLPPHSTH
jgi:hypothetical protein